jgi:hypothetical protein
VSDLRTNTIIIIVHAYCFFLHLISGLPHYITHMYSLFWNKIEDAGAQAVADGLQHCTNLQGLE